MAIRVFYTGNPNNNYQVILLIKPIVFQIAKRVMKRTITFGLILLDRRERKLIKEGKLK